MTKRLYRGEVWFPQKARISPRELLTVLSNRIRYRTTDQQHPRVAECSPSSFQAWIRKWDCRI
jgi:hypothetical protein